MRNLPPDKLLEEIRKGALYSAIDRHEYSDMLAAYIEGGQISGSAANEAVESGKRARTKSVLKWVRTGGEKYHAVPSGKTTFGDELGYWFSEECITWQEAAAARDAGRAARAAIVLERVRKGELHFISEIKGLTTVEDEIRELAETNSISPAQVCEAMIEGEKAAARKILERVEQGYGRAKTTDGRRTQYDELSELAEKGIVTPEQADIARARGAVNEKRFSFE